MHSCFYHDSTHESLHIPHPHVGMRKIKSVLSVFTGFCLWQIIRLFLPGLEVHPIFIYVYGLIEIRETSAKTRLNGLMRIKATFTAIFMGLPLMALLDFCKKRVSLDWMMTALEITFIVLGALAVLCVAEYVKCRMFCGLAAAIYIILMVSHMDESIYLYSVMRACQTIIGVGVAWFINVKILPYPPVPGTLSYHLLSKKEKRKWNAKSIHTIFFDVDGTLLSHKLKKIPDSTKESIKKLREKNIKCVIATGRHLLELNDLPMGDTDFDGYITLNGQLCYDSNKKMILGHPMKEEDRKKILTLFDLKEIPILLIEENRMYINYIDSHVVKAQEQISTPLPEIGEYKGNDLYMAVAYVTKEKEALLKETVPNLKITRWNENAVDLLSGNGDKTDGIKEYLNFYSQDLDNTMAFGDGENDRNMIKAVKLGIAMGNGEEMIKRLSNYVTDSVEEDGIKNALVYYGMIEE